MPKFFVKNNQIKDGKIVITGKDVNHIKNVLRLNIDDDLQICDLDTSVNYACEITKISNETVECNIFNKIDSLSEPNIHIHIFQGLPKSDKSELIIQKCVELGAQEITPVEMKRCVVKIDEKGKAKKIDRWQKISEVAAKQCGRDIIPKVNNIINIKNICNLTSKYDIVLLAYENEQTNTLKNELIKIKEKTKSKNDKFKIAVIIGPEGGIDEEEVNYLKENGAKVITLGKRILRTETVAFVLTSIIMYELGDLGGNV